MGQRLTERMRKGCRLTAAALLFVLITGLCIPAGADIVWPENTEGQRILRDYVALADTFLQEQGELPVNSLFEAYPGFEVFGITDQPDAAVPEGVEITAQLFADGINTLQVRVSFVPRFPQIAAAFIRALNPEMSMEEALATPKRRAKTAQEKPEDSFEDQVEALNGTVPYIYYAYYPDQYHDGVSWIQMTIVFPMAGYWDGSSILNGETATRGPDTYSGHASDYEGYYAEDDYTHYDYVTTPSPEPDSAVYDW